MGNKLGNTTFTKLMLNGATSTGAGSAIDPDVAKQTFQAYGSTTAGSGAATIKIEANNVSLSAADALWITIGTITLTLGTTITTDGFVIDAPWGFIRANVTAISGTGASVTVYSGSGL